MPNGFEFNDLLSVLNIGVLVWVAKRQVGRIDAIEKAVTGLKVRLAKLEGSLRNIVDINH